MQTDPSYHLQTDTSYLQCISTTLCLPREETNSFSERELGEDAKGDEPDKKGFEIVKGREYVCVCVCVYLCMCVSLYESEQDERGEETGS